MYVYQVSYEKKIDEHKLKQDSPGERKRHKTRRIASIHSAILSWGVPLVPPAWNCGIPPAGT